MKKKSKDPCVTRKVLLGICIAFGIVLALLITIALWAQVLLGKIGNLNVHETLSQEQLDEYLQETDVDEHFTGPMLQEEDVVLPEGTAPLIQNEHVLHVLLLGQDRREGVGNGRSDAMILCSLNTKDNTLTLTSFLRDMWVRIPGKYNERLNVAYMVGGSELLNQTLRENFGVVVDYNVEVDFQAFEKLIDILGGVNLELSAAEADYLNQRGNWDVDDSTANTWQLHAGLNQLSGQQALAYSRIRAVGGDGDFGRTGRQRKVLHRLLEQAGEMSVGQMIAAANTVFPLLSTDMSKGEILSYIRKVAPVLPKLKLISQRIPADGSYQFVSIDKKSVLKVDFTAANRLLQQTIGG